MSDSSFVGDAIHPAAMIVFVVIGSAMVISGVLGNILLFLTVVLKQLVRKRCAHHLFIANMAVADIVTLGYWYTFFVLDLELGYHPVVNQTHCVLNGLIVSTMFQVSVSFLTCVTLNRFLSVCHSRLYQRLFTFRRTVVICVAIWVCSTIIATPATFPQVPGHYQYSKELHVCSYDRNGLTYPKVGTLLYATVPMFVIGYWNWAIFRFWRANKMGLSPRYPQLVTGNATGELTSERNLSSRKVNRNDRSDCVGLSHLAGEGDASDDCSPEGHLHDGTEGEDSESSDNLSSGNKNVTVHDSPKDESAPATRSEESADISGGPQTANEADDSNILSFSSVDCQSSSTTTRVRKEEDATCQATPRAESEEPTQHPAPGQMSQCSDEDKIAHVETTSVDRDRSAKAGTLGSKRQRHMKSLKRRERKKLAREMALVRSLLVVSILLFVFFLPFGVIVSTNLYVVLPNEMIVLVITLLFFNSSVNWIVYGVMNPQFRKSYVRCLRALASLLPCSLPCKTTRKKSNSSRRDRS